METNYSIINSISITPQSLRCNGKEIFANQGLGFRDYIRDIYKHYAINYQKFFKMDDLCKLGFIAAELACKDFEFTTSQKENTALILCNCNATLDTDSKFVETLDSLPSPALFVYTLPNIMMGEISIRHGFKGENCFFAEAQFDTQFVYNHAKLILDSTATELCLCGWVDFSNEIEFSAHLTLVSKFASINNCIKFTPNNLSELFYK
ncbi:MAG: 3-oxoacyl-ACP synthase [Bacteroidales bacterium]|nr:3-oxoacyl-ACP synthase [Bacteroidales bacterium]